MTHIAVIGAGITGVTTAYSLLDRGYSVSLFDRHRYAGMETSFANGGQLSASNAEVWTRWSTVLTGIKWMFNRHAPLLMNPLPSWHKYSWMAEFLYNISNYEKHTIETVRLALAARAHLLSYAQREGFSFDCENRGILHIYRTQKDFEHATQVNGLLTQGGLERIPVSPQEMKKIEPTLNGDYYGGFYTQSDFTGDVHLYTQGLSAACKRRGATLQLGATVETLTHTNDGIDVRWVDKNRTHHQTQFDGVVVCAGIESRRFAAQLGDRVNIYPVKGYSITVLLQDVPSQNGAPWTSLLDEHTKIVTSRLGQNRFRVAGTAEFNGVNRDIRDERITPLIRWVEQLFPNIRTEHIVPWAGLRPMTPSMMPRVGAGRKSGVYYNTGHGHLGWTLSAATAEMVADQITISDQKGAPAAR